MVYNKRLTMKHNKNISVHRKKSRSPITIALLLLFIGVLSFFLFSNYILCADTDKSADDSSAGHINQEREKKVPTREPGHVSVVLKNPSKPLVAGETGYLEMDTLLNKVQVPNGKDLIWDQTAATPLTIWISTPPESGIRFVDRDRPDRPYHHFLIKSKAPDANSNQVIKNKIEYTVASDTKTGSHSFWLDISAALMDQEGNKINDTGVETLAFEVDTHLKTKILMIAVVGIVVLLFIMEWVRVDVVAILMMVLLPELGLLNAHDAFRGLSSNAVIAIIGVMIISYGLNRTGLVNRVLQPLMKFVVKSPRRLVVIFSSLIACISGVMQNTGAAVLFLPAIRITSSRGLKISISRVLMPIGMAAILGGTLTMIGTSPLILLNDILPKDMPKFGFLELTPIGLALVTGGILYLSTAGMSMLKRISDSAGDRTQNMEIQSGDKFLESYPLINGPFEIHVPEDYRPNGKAQEIVNIRIRYLVNIVAVAGDSDVQDKAPLPGTSLRPGLALCAYGPEKNIINFVKDYGLVLMDEPQIFKNSMFNPSIAGIVEGVVSPRSGMIGKTIKEISFRETFGVTALALHKKNQTYYRRLAEMPLEPGDMILIHGIWEQFHSLHEFHQNFIIISPFEKEFHKPEKAGWAIFWFVSALVLMFISSFYFQKQPYNPIPLSVCLMIGAVGMVLSRVMTINDAYRSVDWRTVFLLGGLIPLGMAVDQTGTAQWLAKGIVFSLGSYMSPLLLLIVLACLACCFTMVISNVGACALLVPLGISLANQIGIDPRVAAIVVGIGVSNSFILPTHQVNALYMGPGEYRTKDYIRTGGILAIIYITVLVSMVYLFYL
jgi:di/tricarboxylate transporter